jgi:hypothetical protein
MVTVETAVARKLDFFIAMVIHEAFQISKNKCNK